MNLTGIRCIIDGVKHTVLMDDGRTCLVERTTGNRAGSVCKRWVSRQTVDPGAPPPLSRDSEYYFWLGADAEPIGALSEMG